MVHLSGILTCTHTQHRETTGVLALLRICACRRCGKVTWEVFRDTEKARLPFSSDSSRMLGTSGELWRKQDRHWRRIRGDSLFPIFLMHLKFFYS